MYNFPDIGGAMVVLITGQLKEANKTDKRMAV